MPIEAEFKAIVHDVDAVHTALDERTSAEGSTYADRYFDYLDDRQTKLGSRTARAHRHRG